MEAKLEAVRTQRQQDLLKDIAAHAEVMQRKALELACIAATDEQRRVALNVVGDAQSIGERCGVSL